MVKFSLLASVPSVSSNDVSRHDDPNETGKMTGVFNSGKELFAINLNLKAKQQQQNKVNKISIATRRKCQSVLPTVSVANRPLSLPSSISNAIMM